MQESQKPEWVEIEQLHPDTFPTPFTIRFEAVVDHPDFNGEYHFFGIRRTPRTVTHLLSGREIPLNRVKRWRFAEKVERDETDE